MLKIMISLLLMLNLFIVGCSSDDNNQESPSEITGGNNNDGTGGNGDSTIVKRSVKIDLSGAKGLITTENSISTANSASKSSSLHSGPETFTFMDSKNVNRSPSRAGDLSSGTANLFKLNEDGTMSSAVQTDTQIKIQYTLLSKDGKSMYIMFDPFGSQTFVAEQNCSLFSISLEDANASLVCMDKGYMPTTLYDDDYSKKISANLKPLQFDEEGNLYYLGTEMNIQSNCWSDGGHYEQIQDDNGTVTDVYIEGETHCDYYVNSMSGTTAIRKIALDGTVSAITPDNSDIKTLIVMKDGALVYEFDQNDPNTGVSDRGLKLYTDGQTARLTESGSQWYDMFYTVDDYNTVMFSIPNYDNGVINFAQKHPVLEGEAEVLTLDTSLFSEGYGTTTPRKIIVADDGAVYGIFVEQQWEPNSEGENVYVNYVKLYRMLPYSGSPKVSFKIGDDWWAALSGVTIQISQGYAYYVEKQMNETTSTNSYRDIIKIANLKDGQVSSILDAAEDVEYDGIVYDQWLDKYEIYNWKLVNNILYFTGFNNKTSKVQSGEIDTLKVKAGAPASEYLVIKDAASALGESAKITDMEIITAVEPDVNTGNAPRIENIYSDSENVYSASVSFSKYMDRKDVTDKTTIKKTSDDSDVKKMIVWFHKSMHIIFDGVKGNTKTDPLQYETEYKLSVDGTAKDKYGQALNTAENADGSPLLLSRTFTTRPVNGWYTSSFGPDNAVADRYIGKYVTEQYDGSKYIALDNNLSNRNVRIEFSVKADGGSIALRLRDSKRVDSSKTLEVYCDSNDSVTCINDTRYKFVEGYYRDANGTKYRNDYISDECSGSTKYVNIEDESLYYSETPYYMTLIDNNNTILETYTQTYFYDAATEVGECKWTKSSDGTVVDDVYAEPTGDQSINNVGGEWKDQDGNVIAWDNNIYYVDAKLVNTLDETDVRPESDRWNLGMINQTVITAESLIDNNSTENILFDLNLQNGTSRYDTRYYDVDNVEHSMIASEDWISTGIMNNEWAKAVVDFYGTTFKVTIISADGSSHVLYNVSDYYTNRAAVTNAGFTGWKLDMLINSSYVSLDNIKVTELDENGAVVAEKLNLDFSNGIAPMLTRLLSYDNGGY